MTTITIEDLELEVAARLKARDEAVIFYAWRTVDHEESKILALRRRIRQIEDGGA